jgi:hypothetical protein
MGQLDLFFEYAGIAVGFVLILLAAVWVLQRLFNEVTGKSRRQREARRYASDAFPRRVEVWRERAAKARENLPPGASGDEVMARARAEVNAPEGH